MQERDLKPYTECGLDKVYIRSLDPLADDQGKEVIHIRNVNVLHKLIARAIVQRDTAMSGPDLRFLRTEMGFTQSQFAAHIHSGAKMIAKWEKGQEPVPEADQMNVRILAVEKLDLKGCPLGIAAKRASNVNSICINEIDPGKYELEIS